MNLYDSIDISHYEGVLNCLWQLHLFALSLALKIFRVNESFINKHIVSGSR